MQNVNYKEIGSVDLNTFNMVGIYKVTSTCSNQPSNINTPYILENYEGFQIIKTLDRVYFRKRDSNNTWSGWNNPISDLQTQHNQDVLLSTNTNEIGKFIDLNANNFRLPDFRGAFIRISYTNSIYSQYNGGSLNSYDFDKFKSHRHSFIAFPRVVSYRTNTNTYGDGLESSIIDYTNYEGSNETAPFRISLRLAIKYEYSKFIRYK